MPMTEEQRRYELAALRRKAEAVGLISPAGLPLDGYRLDAANETAQLQRALTYIEAQIYDVQYPELRHKEFIPQDASVPAGAESIIYRMFDQIRNAKLISDYADDLPFADVVQSEFPIPIKTLGSAFKYSLRDLQHAAFSGIPLDQKRGQAARDSIEFELDDIACFGRPQVGLLGFVNNPYVDVISVANAGGSIPWSAKTSLQMIADLALLAAHVVAKTNRIYRINTILMPSTLFELIKMAPFSLNSDRTVLEWFKANNSNIVIDAWSQLDKANAAGTGGRIVGYLKDPRVLEEKLPMPFTQLPPQPKSLAFVVPCWALTAGTHIYQPGACCYMDGAN